MRRRRVSELDAGRLFGGRQETGDAEKVKLLAFESAKGQISSRLPT
jgi:hypothetical protein